MLYALPIAYGLCIWWLSTGIIFYLDGLPARTFRWSMLGATAILAASAYGLWATANGSSLTGAYISFTCGLLAWGWQEISLYMGYVTGPRKHRCAAGCSGWKHFVHAVEANLWHELAIIAAAAVIVAIAWTGANQIGMWTFLVLWWMHLSARLNVFLGVRNVSEEFVPAHMVVLKSFLTRKPMNLLFPVSVTVSTVAAMVLFDRAASAGSAFDITFYVFLGTLMVLALLEHWFLMLPLPADKLWRWSLSSHKETAKPEGDAAKGLPFSTLETARAG